MAQQSILLVDDDLHSARILEVSLRNAGYSITTARNGAEAMVKIEAIHPALVIAAASLPVMDGLTLCGRVKKTPSMKQLPVFLITDEHDTGLKAQGVGADEVLARPIFTQELLTRIRLLLQRRSREALQGREKQRFFGRLEDLSVVDLIQLVPRWEHGTITLESEQVMGRVVFQEGAVIDAALGTRKGAQAIYRMLTWHSGTFEIDFNPIDHPTKIHATIQDLLFEGMRRADEWGRMCEQLPPLSAVFQVDFSELAERLAELPPEVNDLLKLFDGRRDALTVIDEAEIDDLEALSALSRLYFEGILYEQSHQHALPAPEEDAIDDWLPDAPLGADPGDIEPVDFQLSDEDLGLSVPPKPERDLVDDLIASAAPDDGPEETGAFALDDDFSLPDDDQLLFDPDAVEEPEPAAPPPAPEPAAGPAAIPTIEPDPVPMEDDPLGFGDIGALPSTSNIIGQSSEAIFFERSPEEIEALEDHLDHEPISRVALFTFGALGAAALAGVVFFTLQDTVKPRAAELPPLAHSWHTEILKQRVLPKEIAPIDAPWETPKGEGASAKIEQPAAPDVEAPEGADVEAAEPPPSPEADSAQLIALVDEGKVLQDKGRYREAIKRFEEALGISPNSERALLPLANALLEDGRDQRALQIALKAAKINNANPQAQLIIGSAQQNLGRKEAAIEAYERYLKLAPSGAFATDVRQVLKGMQ